MCSLIVLRGVCERHSLFVAANRDERTDRASSPPGVWRGERRSVLSPRDRVAGGTWLAVDELGRFAGITNIYGEPPVPGAPSRGHLAHLALDQPDLRGGADAVLRRLRAAPHAAFQLVLAEPQRVLVIRHASDGTTCRDHDQPVVALSNEHAVGEWSPRGLEPALAPALGLDARLDALARCVQDRGGDGEHVVCKHGADYATVSSSLIAVQRSGVAGSVWRFAPGPPDVTPFRDYGNLFARLQG
ncbi:MAG: NRDE family protein [Planctomycetota bacterium]